LLGSIPFGLLIGKIFGHSDVRREGSGNIGATNVARSAGALAGALTLLLDTGKGAAAVYVAMRLAPDSSEWMMAGALGVIGGHCFPVWLKFRGGKGVATAAGIFAVICLPAMLAALVIFLLVAFTWRYVSLGSIAAAAAIPLLIYFLWAPGHAPAAAISFGSVAISLLVIYKHDGNMQRLIRGEEPRFSFREFRRNR
jgi:glycerol-3-phosphate acyltransferase PlsY